MKQLRVLHKQTKKKAKELKKEVDCLSERNQSLVADLSRSIGQQEELKKLNQDLQMRIDDALIHRTSSSLKKVDTFLARVDQGAEELRWVVKEGIPLFVRALLDSSDFSIVNATLHTSSIQLGLHQDCVGLKEKYPEELKDKSVLYSYPDAQRQIIDRISEMTTYKYSFLSALGE
ncbi:unnamed protein product [Lactuca saligna]|uniref:Uncharacterized protein n=1 Tax=Lactuca saligna TaxID=75948 RepID=A0AA35VAV7_LACSI|nr:unnamed protein product [Lactuca saligna]